jgi:prolyl-tRNA editing enzyme YbaK/EbsC (Cys-tRNA(Pro) deacylase)
MVADLTANAQRVQEALRAKGVACQVVELPASTATAKEAAQAIGCTVAQIAKTLLFRTQATQRPLLVIASGVNRVNESRLGQRLGEPIEKADADFVREKTGFAIGGVPPVGHAEPIETWIDEDLLKHEVIWAAAGTPHAVFRLTPAELERVTGGKPISVH